jgi:hypothetical protein
MRTSQTSDLIEDIDTWLSENISDTEHLEQDLEALGATRLPANDLERMFRALGDLRALQSNPIFWDRWRPTMLNHEACALVRYENHTVDLRELLLFEARTRHGEEGALPRAQIYRNAIGLLGAERPRIDTLNTVFLHLDRGENRTTWPKDPEADPRCREVRSALEDIRKILESNAPALPRVLRAWQRAARIVLPERGVDLDPEVPDDRAAKAVLDRIEPDDLVGAFASIVMSYAIWSTGLVDRPVYMTSQTLRTTSGEDGDATMMSWVVRVLTESAERTVKRSRNAKLAIEVLDDRIGKMDGRDRMRGTLLEVLIRAPIGTPETIAAAGVSRKSAMTFLDRMVKEGVCDWRGGRETRIYEVQVLTNG